MVVDLAKIKKELFATIEELIKTKTRLRQANTLIRQLAISTTPRFLTPSSPHPLAPINNNNLLSYSSTIASLDLCSDSLLATYCCKLEDNTVYDNEATPPTREEVRENKRYFHDYCQLLDIIQYLPPDPLEYHE